MHDTPWSAHVGRTRTLAILRTAYWWPSIDKDVAAYVASCDSCQRIKAHHGLKNNLLVPLLVPKRPFQIIGVDFITCLPATSQRFDAVCVIVCHFTKLAHFIPCHTAITSKEVAALFRKHFFRHHGLPMHIVSNRGARFVAQFCNQLCADLDITLRHTSSHQQSTDGRKELTKFLKRPCGLMLIISTRTGMSGLTVLSSLITEKLSQHMVCHHFHSCITSIRWHPPTWLYIKTCRSVLNIFSEICAKPSTKTRAGRKYAISWITKFRTARELL